MKKYTTADLKNKLGDSEKDKLVISNDAYALCEFLECLVNKGLMR